MVTGRRNFIKTLSGGAIALPFTFHSLFSGPSEKNMLRLFSKPLDSYDFDFVCECVSHAKIGGIDLTVRPGGRVEPSKVETDLPFYIEKARKHGLIIDMIVTGIVSADDNFAERIIKTAADCGVKCYRLGWINYDFNKNIKANIADCKKTFYSLADINKRYNINGCYQNHEGNYIGSAIWDLYEILEGLPKDYIGCQYDVRHAVVEGSNSWEAGMRLISPYISSIAVKDFKRTITDNRSQLVNVPLGEGIVNWDKYFSILKHNSFNGPVSLHIEYELINDVEKDLSTAEKLNIIVQKLSRDAGFIMNRIT